MKASSIIVVGLAIFTMIFGAGNVVFPLGVGRDMGSMVLFALFGLIITGVAMPILGLVASIFYEGRYKKFLSILGPIPASLIIFGCLMVLGPFGATPRALTISYGAIRWHFPGLSLFVFSIMVSILLFLSTMKHTRIIDIMGKVLAPMKLTLLSSIILIGLFATAGTPLPSDVSAWKSFSFGILKGNEMMDLLATIFFSGLIFTSIKRYGRRDGLEFTDRQMAIVGVKAGLIGGGLVALVYTGFCLLAAKCGSQIMNVPTDQLLSALATIVTGPRTTFLANIMVALACFSTAMVWTVVFSNYLRTEIFKGRITYIYALLITVTLNFIMTNLGFEGISHIIERAMMVVYPMLIVFSLSSIAYKLWNFQYVRSVTFGTLALTVLLRLL